MSRRAVQAFRGLRKTAYISRKVFSKAANLSGRIEQKTDRIIHGTDATIKIQDKILFEKLFAEAIPEIVPIHPALPLAGRNSNVTLLIPSLQKSSFFGGTATALILASKLAIGKNVGLRIVETLSHGNAKVDELALFIQSTGVDLHSENIELINLSSRRYNHYGYLDIHPEDIYMASAWWDAHLLDQLPLLKPYIYLIQDYEPIFYNNSDKYVMAERTYHSDRFIPVCNTELMYRFMVGEGYRNIEKKALWFEPAVGIKDNLKRTKSKKKKLFIYGRPSVARNMFYFTLSCIDELFSTQQLSGAEWEIYMAGQDNLADIVLGSGMTISNLGKMSLQDYYTFIHTVDVAISPMMAPHPNYPTLEFASVGAAVVTTKYKEKTDLSRYSKNIFMAELIKQDMQDKIIKAANLTLKQRLENHATSNIKSDWNETLTPIVMTLMDVV